MKTLPLLNKTAHTALTPLVKPIPLRLQAARDYPLLLQDLYTANPHIIGETLRRYNYHLDRFLNAVEHKRQNETIKAALLAYPIEQGIRAIVAGTRVQKNAEQPVSITVIQLNNEYVIEDYLSFANFRPTRHYLQSLFSPAVKGDSAASANPDSILAQTLNTIDFTNIMNRLCRIAENTKAHSLVRNQAVKTLSSVYTHSVQNFGLQIDRETLEQRMVGVGIYASNAGLQKSALEFADRLYPISIKSPS